MRMLTEPFQLFLGLVCSVRCLLLIRCLPSSLFLLTLCLLPFPLLPASPLHPAPCLMCPPPGSMSPPFSLLPASSNRIRVCILYFPPLSAWRFTDWTEMDWMSIEFIWIPECWKDGTYVHILKIFVKWMGVERIKLSSNGIQRWNKILSKTTERVQCLKNEMWNVYSKFRNILIYFKRMIWKCMLNYPRFVIIIRSARMSRFLLTNCCRRSCILSAILLASSFSIVHQSIEICQLLSYFKNLRNA